MNFKLFSFVILLLSFFVKCNAQSEIDTIYRHQFTVFPYPAYAQETSWEFGAVSIYQFKLANATFNTRPSNLDFVGFYTLENQMRIRLRHTIFTKDENWVFEGLADYAKYPEKYYGVGNNTPIDNEQLMSWSKIEFRQQLLKKLHDKMFLGLQYRIVNFWEISVENRADGTGSLEEIPGYQGGVNSGVGVVYKWDKRNYVLAPTKGHFIELRAVTYTNWLGSNYLFNTIELDMRKYFSLNPRKPHNTVLAFQGILNQSYGTVPFRELSLMGGFVMMRGVYQGRFRDNHIMAFQSELRQHLFWRIGMTAFFSIAQVSPNWNSFQIGQFKLAGGAGFRLLINKDDRATLRADYGLGPDGSSGLYLTLGEAF
ncbi:BamA/TamA family outer membrane protein [Flammeovirga aprica]|uniref:BamA/TamA family outer membrane protein n=1 Tax=Flammeovirga aprica JL-4 TaxID=694437 RepID=A0A7X9RYD8_9BACT|nr:BamA/TamA family outer membrane protein [Flammeovirga aprica]NME70899.1 BamA/TamA family outer membrane protein [Flammeovirga aprica JL-4]